MPKLDKSTKAENSVGYYIKKDNNLTKAEFYNISVSAYRVILLASSDKFAKQLADNPSAFIRISPADYHDVYGSGADVSPSYRALKSAIDELEGATIRRKNFKLEDSEGKWDREFTHWVSRVRYSEELKALEIKFDPDIVPMILNVHRNYTYYNLRNVAKLNSMHSVRLYELMMFWRKKGNTPALSVAYMRAWLGVKDGLHEEMKVFNRDVIKKSVTEISKKTDINLEFSPQKEGKSTTGYVFSYTPKNAQLNGDGQDESYDQGKAESSFPPPNEADDEDVELPF